MVKKYIRLLIIILNSLIHTVLGFFTLDPISKILYLLRASSCSNTTQMLLSTSYKTPDSIFPRVTFVEHTLPFPDKHKYTHIYKVSSSQHPLPSVQTIQVTHSPAGAWLCSRVGSSPCPWLQIRRTHIQDAFPPRLNLSFALIKQPWGSSQQKEA